MTTLAIVSAIFGVPVLFDISFIIAFGLAVDVLNTYMMNVSILRWYKFHGVKR